MEISQSFTRVLFSTQKLLAFCERKLKDGRFSASMSRLKQWYNGQTLVPFSVDGPVIVEMQPS
jgi:hypothetical protein